MFKISLKCCNGLCLKVNKFNDLVNDYIVLGSKIDVI